MALASDPYYRRWVHHLKKYIYLVNSTFKPYLTRNSFEQHKYTGFFWQLIFLVWDVFSAYLAFKLFSLFVLLLATVTLESLPIYNTIIIILLYNIIMKVLWFIYNKHIECSFCDSHDQIWYMMMNKSKPVKYMYKSN